MAITTNLALTLVSQSQSQKEVTVNNALNIIDAILNTGARDKDLATPPSNPAEGDLYIVAGSPTGAWIGHAGDIAYYLNGAWAFLDPNEGFYIWVNDEDALYVFDGTHWVFAAKTIQNATLIGINTTADITNKLSVASPAILFNHAGNGCQVKVNKNAVSDTASLLFQTAFSGRAEMGLTADNDFHFKVSSDGSAWKEAFIIDRNTGDARFQKFLGFGAPAKLIIINGIVTATKTYHSIDTEGSAATDNLDSINGGNEGDILILKAADSTRTIVVKDGTGNLKLNGDFPLNNTEDRITLQKDGSTWVEISRSDNGA